MFSYYSFYDEKVYVKLDGIIFELPITAIYRNQHQLYYYTTVSQTYRIEVKPNNDGLIDFYCNDSLMIYLEPHKFKFNKFKKIKRNLPSWF